jgi:anti-sigma regulatory factor (Ser/Thr protein kinase)
MGTGAHVLVLLPPSPASARAARQLAVEALTALKRPELVDDATAVVSELVTNAVMHARTDVEVSVLPAGAGVRVAVSDGSRTLPCWTPASATATSGRGLILVRSLSSDWGAEPHAAGKTVWALIERAAEVSTDRSVEDLLALWAVDEPGAAELPSPMLVPVELAVDVAAMLDSRSHTEDLIRELQLIVFSGSHRTVPAAVRQLTDRLAAATVAFGDPRRQILHQTLSAAQQGRTTVTLRLHLRREDAKAARQWLAALDEAEALTADGLLLLPPFPQALTEFRREYINAILARLQEP